MALSLVPKIQTTSSLAHRVTVAMWLVSAISCLLAILLSTILIVKNSERIAHDRINDAESTLVSLGFLELLSQNSGGELDELISETLEAANLSEVVQIYEPPGKLLLTNMRSDEFAEFPNDLSKFVDRGFFLREGPERKFLDLVRSYRASNGRVFWLEIATPRPLIERVLRENILPFSSIFLILILFSLGAARFVAVKSLAPLTKIATHLDTLDSNAIKRWQQIPLEESPKDFRSIVVKMNELILRVQTSFLKFHQMGQFIAHEIRTPLTIIRGEIETTLMNPSADVEQKTAVLQSALDEVTRMDEIVSTVLRISARDRNLKPYRPETIDLKRFLEELLPVFAKFVQRKIKFSVESETSSYEVFIDRELFNLLISNLIRNIAKHTPVDAEAELLIKRPSDSYLVLEVLDQGPGLPEEVLLEANDSKGIGEHLGLGLTLAREVAQIGRLGLEFENRHPRGLLVRISCPLNARYLGM